MRSTRLFVCALLLLQSSALHAADNFVKEADIAYLGDAADTDYAKTQCKLDVYRPAGATGYATIVWFHGGGLTGGSRESGVTFAKRFTAEGFGVVLVSYRFSPKVKCPTYIEDAAASVAWTIRHIADYGGDPKKVFVSGHSAGGFLTAMVGMDPHYLGKHGLSPNDVAGYMPISGQMITHFTIRAERGIAGTQPIIDAFAPSYWVRKDAPPFLNIAGDHDMAARAEENVYFTAAMHAAGNMQAQCIVVKDRTHGSIVGHFKDADDEVAAAMLKFMHDVMNLRK
ncbi:MAG: alpha/beta hydrolase fold domain-containing protein [Planctomycetes bacterium]|nr:alpha/beta hydrolase fold domain-containing protein [Planctomycetota bacterium]